MGREVRRVPANWQHPKKENGHYVALHEGDYGGGFAVADAEWNRAYQKWQEGFREAWSGDVKWVPKDETHMGVSFTEWHGSRPSPDDYMPQWSPEVATHYQMYEDTSEGTPISPVFATPEELARWLADTGASACGDMTASYEAWLRVCNGGYAPSMVMDQNGLQSGVEALKDNR